MTDRKIVISVNVKSKERLADRLAKWLARKTPLRKPNCGKQIISIKPRPKIAYDFLGSIILLVHYIVSLFNCMKCLSCYCRH